MNSAKRGSRLPMDTHHGAPLTRHILETACSQIADLFANHRITAVPLWRAYLIRTTGTSVSGPPPHAKLDFCIRPDSYYAALGAIESYFNRLPSFRGTVSHDYLIEREGIPVRLHLRSKLPAHGTVPPDFDALNLQEETATCSPLPPPDAALVLFVALYAPGLFRQPADTVREATDAFTSLPGFSASRCAAWASRLGVGPAVTALLSGSYAGFSSILCRWSDYPRRTLFGRIRTKIAARGALFRESLSKTADFLLKGPAIRHEPVAFDLVARSVLSVPTTIDVESKLPEPVLISTNSGLWYGKERRLTRITPGVCWGITRRENRWFVYQNTGTRGRIISFRLSLIDGLPLAADQETILGRLPSFIHQIDFYGEELLIADTDHNRLLIFDPHRGRYAIFPAGRARGKGEHPHYAHFNALFGGNDCLYLMANNRPHRSGRRSCIYLLDHKKHITDRIQTQSMGAHNVIVTPGGILFCDSPRGALMLNEKELFQSAGSFLRGLSLTDRHIIVGGSTMTARDNRTGTDGTLFFLSHSGQKRSQHVLKSLGQIYDIRALSTDYSLSNTPGAGPVLHP